MLLVRLINGEKFTIDMTVKEFYQHMNDELDVLGFSWIFSDYAIVPKQITSIQEYEE